MSLRIYFIIFLAVMLLLIPFVPQMLRFRIWFLRKLHLYSLARFHERYFEGLVLAIRILMLAGVLLALIVIFGNS